MRAAGCGGLPKRFGKKQRRQNAALYLFILFYALFECVLPLWNQSIAALKLLENGKNGTDKTKAAYIAATVVMMVCNEAKGTRNQSVSDFA